MHILKDIHPLTDFKRKTSEIVKHIKSSGRPTILTVNGKPELVVQDAASYQKMLDSIEYMETIRGIERGLEAMQKSEYISADNAFKQLKKKFKIEE